MLRQLVWLVSLSPLYIMCNVHAQGIDNVVLRKYAQAKSSANYNIRKIIKDRFGFLWIASQDGLNRFDGVNFLTYSKNAATSDRRLAGVEVRDIIEDTIHNCLWVFSGETGITRIDLVTGKVIATGNAQRNWSTPIVLELVFLPRWYQTVLFRIGLLLLAIGLLYSLYHYRLTALKKEERIRARIASDLHDDIGSTLNSVKIYANLAMMKPDNAFYLLQLKEGVQNAIASVKDMVWVLDDKKDTADHLITRLLQFAEPLCDANGILLKKEIAESCYNYKLSKEERRNLYMIIKESINNSIKYAGCTMIVLTIQPNGKYLSISVSDDGTGFNTESFVPGNGLKNIRERAREVGYREEIIAAPGQGTTVALARS